MAGEQSNLLGAIEVEPVSEAWEEDSHLRRCRCACIWYSKSRYNQLLSSFTAQWDSYCVTSELLNDETIGMRKG